LVRGIPALVAIVEAARLLREKGLGRIERVVLEKRRFIQCCRLAGI
jgi:hypothetical protein